MVFLYHAFHLKVMIFLIPLSLYILPLAIKGRVSFRFSFNNIAIGFIASVLVLSPAITVVYLAGRDFHLVDLMRSVPYQLFGVALPEEVYFRGYLQEELGNNIRAVVLVSLLFSIMHLPQLIFYGEFLAPLTFFPSLIMGYLYKRTGNILTPAIFHFLANMVFYGFYRT